MTVVTELVAKLSVDGVEESGRKLGGFTQTLESASGSARKWGGILSVGVTAPLILFGNQAAGTASDVNESLSKVNVVFGDSAAAVTAFSETTTEAFGISEGAALEAAGTFGTIFSGVGIAQDAAADMSTTMLGLAGDLASFNNLETGDALEKLRSGLVGEAEPLRALGIVMSEAEVTAKAMALGLADVATELTAADKVQARYALILEKTTLAQGDAGRTIGEAAGQAKVQAAAMQDLSATIGGQLLPIKMQLMGVVSRLITAFTNLSPGAQSVIVKVGMLAAAVGPLLAGLGMVLPAIGAIGAALGVLLSPIGLVVAAIALLAAAWATNFGGIQDKTAAVMGYLKGVIESVLGGILAFWQANGEQIMAVVTFVWDQVKVIFEGAFTVLSSIFAAFKAAFSGDWEGFGRNLRVAWDTVWKTILTVLRNIIPIIRTAITDLAKAIIQNFKDTNWKELGLAILDGIVKVLAGAKDVIVGVIKGLLGGAMGAVKGFFGIGGGNESGAGASPAGGSRQPLGPAMGGGLAMPGMSGGGDYATQGRTAGQQWAAAYAQAVQEHISGMGEAIAASLQPPVDYRYRRATVGVRALP